MDTLFFFLQTADNSYLGLSYPLRLLGLDRSEGFLHSTTDYCL